MVRPARIRARRHRPPRSARVAKRARRSPRASARAGAARRERAAAAREVCGWLESACPAPAAARARRPHPAARDGSGASSAAPPPRGGGAVTFGEGRTGTRIGRLAGAGPEHLADPRLARPSQGPTWTRLVTWVGSGFRFQERAWMKGRAGRWPAVEGTSIVSRLWRRRTCGCAAPPCAWCFSTERRCQAWRRLDGWTASVALFLRDYGGVGPCWMALSRVYVGSGSKSRFETLQRRTERLQLLRRGILR